MRITYNVVWLNNHWIITKTGDDDFPINLSGPTPTMSVNTSKFWAFLTARKFAKDLHKNGIRSRVIVYNKDGTIQLTRSYGEDGVFYTFDKNANLVVNFNSLITSKGFRQQIKAANELKAYNEKLKKSKT